MATGNKKAAEPMTFDKELSRQIDWLLKRIEEGCEDEDDMKRILRLCEEQIPPLDTDEE